MTPLDFNADLGEGGRNDAELMRLVTSANISCGLHAGDAQTIYRTMELAKANGVRVGAHPSLPDRANFGRNEIPYTPQQLLIDVTHQIAGFLAIAELVEVEVKYLKPHGALYHMTNNDPALAQALALVAGRFGLSVMGFPEMALHAACKQLQIAFFREGYADRRYQPDGTLVPRSQPTALIHDPAEAVEQLKRLAGKVESICVHGDTEGAVELLRSIVNQFRS